MSEYFLADDLSGALDAAAGFHHAGRRVTIALSPHDWPLTSTNDVVGITTETRNASADTAADVVKTVIARGKARGARLLYKKIDSTLRGPVAAEVAALAAAMPEARVLFCPANPRAGRTVRNGVLLVNGVPVAETEFGHDPICPVRESSIAAVLGAAMSSRIFVADASSENDLAAAVARINASDGPWVAVGSGALARPVAALRARQQPPRLPALGAPPVEGPILFVCGSANLLNRKQAAQLARVCSVPLLEVGQREMARVIRAAIESVRHHGVAALMIPRQRVESAGALRALVLAARTVISDTDVARVFATGGETAFALCHELQIKALEFQAEIESGLSLSRALTRAGGPMLWAVKPGGFGDDQTWVRALNALREGRGEK